MIANPNLTAMAMTRENKVDGVGPQFVVVLRVMTQEFLPIVPLAPKTATVLIFNYSLSSFIRLFILWLHLFQVQTVIPCGKGAF